jgi:hypothetical protein
VIEGAIPTERNIQRAILQMCGVCFPDIFIHHSPNGAQLAGSSVARFKQMGALKGDGTKAGFPDLICLWNGGGTLPEVKRPKTGRVSPEQKALHARLEAIGWPVAIVTSQSEAHAALSAAGAPIGKVWQ